MCTGTIGLLLLSSEFEDIELVDTSDIWRIFIPAGLFCFVTILLLIYKLNKIFMGKWLRIKKVAKLMPLFILSGITLLIVSLNHVGDYWAPSYREVQVTNKTCTLTCHDLRGKYSNPGPGKKHLTEAQCLPENRKVEYDYYSNRCFTARVEYEMQSTHWLPEQKEFNFQVSRNVFDAVQPGMRMNIPVHHGLFGVKWVRYSEIEPPQ